MSLHRGRVSRPRAGPARAAPGWRSHPAWKPSQRRNPTGPFVGSRGCGVVGCPLVSDGAAARGDGASSRARDEAQPRTDPSRSCPDWEGPCLQQSCRTLLGELAGSGPHAAARVVPRPGGRGHQVVLLVIDGLGEEQLRERAALAPVLASGVGGPITSVAPSTTACALTTLVTGRVPAEHGVVGYRVALDGDVMNVLQWSAPRSGRPGVGAGVGVPAVRVVPRCPRSGPGGDPARLRARRGSPPPTWADVELHRWHTPAGLVTAVRELAAGGAPFVYAYYEGIDKVAHAEGLGPVLRRRAARRSIASSATCSEALPPGCGARRHRGPRAGRGRRLGRAPRARDHGGGDADQRGRTVPLAPRPPGRHRTTSRPRPRRSTATSPGCGPRSR